MADLDLDYLLDFGFERTLEQPGGDGLASDLAVPVGVAPVSGASTVAVDIGSQVGSSVSFRQRSSSQIQFENDRVSSYKLAPFWSQNVSLWFAQAEGSFELNGERDSRRKFFRVLSALDPVVIRQVADLVESVPLTAPYEALKARLLSASKVSDYQKAEKVMSLPPLGDRKPSALMAEMLEHCPRGWEHEKWFSFHFLSRLPSHVRVLMKDKETADLRLLAERADEIAALFVPGPVQGLGAVFNNVFQAGTQQEDVQLAAMGAGQQQQQRQQHQQHNNGGQYKGQKTANSRDRGKSLVQKVSELDHVKTARLAAGLCKAHWKFGARCFSKSCTKPCVLSEN